MGSEMCIRDRSDLPHRLLLSSAEFLAFGAGGDDVDFVLPGLGPVAVVGLGVQVAVVGGPEVVEDRIALLQPQGLSPEDLLSNRDKSLVFEPVQGYSPFRILATKKPPTSFLCG